MGALERLEATDLACWWHLHGRCPAPAQHSVAHGLPPPRQHERMNVQVQAVAAALDIHPFMLSRWRKAVRDGVLRGGRAPAVKGPPAREIRRLQEIGRASCRERVEIS